jgi:polyketide cyclase/dehydrase/lipid transport protein
VSKIERSIVIDRPVGEVFNFVHDPRNDASWQTTLIESTQVDDGPLRVGTQIRERRRFLGIQVEMTKEITEFEPTRRSAFEMVAGGAL